ncbi:alpha/beta hydrolase family protein [Lysobacter tyrosinilyticus]
MKQLALILALGAGFTAVPATAAVNVGAYVKKDAFNDVQLSPNGDYYAATVKLEDRTALVVIRRADNKLTANIGAGKNTVVDDFWWVSPERVVASIAEKFGALDRPQATGELYAVNADGSHTENLVGYRVQGRAGSHIQPKKEEAVSAFVVDDLPSDDKNIIIQVWPWGDDPYTRAEKMDVYTGRRALLARAPVRRADFTTDNKGVVRFAHGAGADNVSKLYYRKGDGADWQLINDEGTTGLVEHPIGFSADDKLAYFQAEQKAGPDAIVSYDVESGKRTTVLRDDDADPARIIYRNGTRIPVGAVFMDGKPRTAFLDDASPEARTYRSLEAAFPGETVTITSQTADGKLVLFQVSSDRNPGDYYTYDLTTKKAAHQVSRRDWFDPAKMASMKPIQLKARDGLTLNGYLTLPTAGGDKNLPLIVMPHGGPFGIQDVWGFDTEPQLLASAGYAVLQLNFRGSGGYGEAFESAGAKQWGGTMQDDVTDATRWAIQQGIADAGRICIYGASYGGYAALMGVAKEPTLYKCAAGYVGVYDLPTMHTHGDIQQRGSGETYLKEWIGARDELGAVSPNRMADRIKVPVFLAAGGEDERAPIEHSRKMEAALKAAGVPVETLYYDTEGHGFYLEAHQLEYYTRLLAFLGKHLGGQTAAAPTGAAQPGK